jgi:chromate reductase, NAD(P)H dehydrogenase (quinone)
MSIATATATTVASTASQKPKVLAVCGSTRNGSFNRMLMAEAIAAVGDSATVQIVELNSPDLSMPFYCGTLEVTDGLPKGARHFRQMLQSSDLLLFVTPEHNGSVPAVLKNALDWASRDEKKQPSRDAFQDKPALLMSTSPSPYGGARAVANLRTILENVGTRVLPAPHQVSVGGCYSCFDAKSGKLIDDKQKDAVHVAVKSLLKLHAAAVPG